MCINQHDNQEKGHQVRLMRYIYAQAFSVVAWVGEESESDSGVTVLEDYLMLATERLRKKNAIKENIHYVKPMDQMSKAEKPEKGEPNPEDDLRIRISLTRFIQRPWWHRVWIIQEAALAPELVFQYGKTRFELGLLIRALEASLSEEVLFFNTTKVDRVMEAALTMFRIRELASGKEVWKQQNSIEAFRPHFTFEDRVSSTIVDGDLIHLVKAARSFSSTNGKDHVYALLGLTTPEESEAFNVNYNGATNKVYIDFAKTIITRNRSLDILAEASSLENPDLPSWVPDWSQKSEAHSLIRGPESALETRNATEATFSWSDDFRVLHVSAKCVDRIVELTPGFDPKKGKKDGQPAETDAQAEKRVRDFFKNSQRPWHATSTTENGAEDVYEKMWLETHDAISYPTKAIEKAILKPTIPSPVKALKMAPMYVDGIWYIACSSASWIKDYVTKEGRTARITAEMEQSWDKTAHTGVKYKNEEEFFRAYSETVHGGSLFSELGNPEFVDEFREELFHIWRERLEENPLVQKEGFLWDLQKKNYKPVQISEKLRLRYFELRPSGNSDIEIMGKKRDEFVQINSSTKFPSLMPKKNYEIMKAVEKPFSIAGIGVAQGVTKIYKAAKDKSNKSNKFDSEEVPSLINSTSTSPGSSAPLTTPKPPSTTDLIPLPDSHPDPKPWKFRGPARRPTDPIFRDADERYAKQELARMYSRHVERAATNRKFCRTETGDMGWVPLATEVGDVVAVLKGTKVPMVLRPITRGEEGEYRLVGAAWIKGLIGEGVEESVRGVKDRTIMLK